MDATDHEAKSTLKGKTQQHERSYACMTWNMLKPQS
jgi:hypothetical protein